MYYIADLCGRHGIGTKGFSPDFFDALAAYGWPGNVRELVHTLERTLTAARHDPALFPKHLPTHLRIRIARSSVSTKAAAKNGPKNGPKTSTDPSRTIPTLRDHRETVIAEAEKEYLHDLMSVTGGNIKEACQASGLSRARLYVLLKKYNISRFD